MKFVTVQMQPFSTREENFLKLENWWKTLIERDSLLISLIQEIGGKKSEKSAEKNNIVTSIKPPLVSLFYDHVYLFEH